MNYGVLIIGFILFILLMNWADKAIDDSIDYNKVMVKESHVLICHFKDGERVVPNSKIKDKDDGIWYFTNGSASNCYLSIKRYYND